MRRWIVGAFVAVLSTSTLQAESKTGVRLDLVNYKQLSEEIHRHHGRVILVDFWGDFCRPCKEKFPYVVALQRKYAAQGLTVITVSIDDLSDPEVRDRVHAYLQSQQAVTRNLLLNEKPEVWISKLKMNSVPTMFLFDREGQMINRWNGNEIHLDQIEKRITELLR